MSFKTNNLTKVNVNPNYYETGLINLLLKYYKKESNKYDLYDYLVNKSNLRTLAIDISETCNQNCRNCFYKTKVNKDIPVDKWFPVVDQALEMGARTFHLPGKEPFMHPGIIDFLKYLDKKKKKYSFIYSVLTNGTLLDKYVDQLSELKMDYLGISIDGLKEKHNFNRHPDSFDLVVKNLELAINKKAGKEVCISAVVSRNNWEELTSNYIDYFIDKGVKNFIFGPFIPVYGKGVFNKQQIMSLDLLEKFVNKLTKKVTSLKSKGLYFLLNLSDVYSIYSPHLLNNMKFKSKLQVGQNGQLYTMDKINGNKLMIEFPVFFELYKTLRIKRGKAIVSTDALISDDWKKFGFGDCFKEPLANVYNNIKKEWMSRIIDRMEQSECRDKECFPFCYGGSHCYNESIGYTGYDYICEQILKK